VTSTTISASVLKAALLTPADVPGATLDPESSAGLDASACFPGNPLGARTYPDEVDSRDLEVIQGKLLRTFASNARPATPAQAKEFVQVSATPGGSACLISAIKAFLSSDPKPPKVDPSGLTGTATSEAIADGGAVLAVRGNLISQGRKLKVEADTVVFSKGAVLISVDTGAIDGSVVPGQALDLARRIAGRLP